MFQYVKKNGSFGKFLHVWPSHLRLPSFPRNYGNVRPKKFIKPNKQQRVFAIDPWQLQRENLICLSHCKTLWTTIVDNVGMKIGLLGTSSSMVNLTFCFFSWCFIVNIKVVPGQVQQPMTYFRGARDNFMVHDVNKPSKAKNIARIRSFKKSTYVHFR